MEDLHSSDIEFEPPPPNPFHQAGQASIVQMLDHAFEDRIASKRTTKQLTFVKGAPSTQYIHALWGNRFNHFRQHTLNKRYKMNASLVRHDVTDNSYSSDIVPTAKDLERFFSSVVSRVTPRGNEVPTYTWLKNAIGHTVEVCVFHYKAFTLSPHERLRIGTLLHSLLQEGKLTYDPAWDRNWAGVVVVRKLISSLATQAFEEGTLSWDITIARCLSIVLVAALGARAGDVTVAPLDKHTLPFLAYKDVVVKMKYGDGIGDLDTVLTIRNEKCNKYVSRTSMKCAS